MPPVPRLSIGRRFCGPPDSANGGYAAGLLAAFVDGPAEVTLRRPPPLETPMTVARDGDGSVISLQDGDVVVAEAVPATIELDPPAPVALADAREAAARAATIVHPDWHPFPTCFVCGPDRDPGDGLRIFAGPVAGRDVYAAPWTPAREHTGPDGRVRTEIVWAALDCPSSGPLYVDGRRPDAPYVLGRIAVRIDGRPEAGEPLVAISWALAREGRKLFAASALRDASGRILAIARATWISLRAA
jgi:hypothetical protein